MYVLLEVDVTKARRLIRSYKQKTGEPLSFTAWLITCIAKAVSRHKQVQAYRKGKTLITFDDVDVGFAMDRQAPQQSGSIVMAGVLRKTNEKTVKQVSEELRAAQAAKPTHGTVVGETEEANLAGFMQSLPAPLRRLAVTWYRRDPFLRKRMQGTVGISSVGNVVGATSGLCAFPMVSGVFPLYFVVGSVARKPGVVGDRVEVCEYLPMSVGFDHDVVDGADAARFLGTLGELLKDGYGLEELVTSVDGPVAHQAVQSTAEPALPASG
jgi:pyruvate/2-oxoglutarate dehydrogenase complex dihydrolipoamide acyltransferase (E2) component